jgi:hypothetical protein
MNDKQIVNAIAFFTATPAFVGVALGSILLIAWGLEWWKVWIISTIFLFSGAWALACGQTRDKELKELK